ncbi:MAG: DUF4032 domain-containing protein, partial [Anaerolineales bacterium]
IEFNLLSSIQELRLPAITPVGYANTETSNGAASVLITRYLDHSIPYRSIFMRDSLDRYLEHLLDAIAGLLIQIHLAGVYWGDCSLSNTLFRRDAGELQAYLVDAETSEIHPNNLPPALRHQDLVIMEENINGELADLVAAELTPKELPTRDTGAYIRLRYQRLWEEITREDIINPGEHYRIQERIRALNNLGFSIGDVELHPTSGGNQLRLHIKVADRNFHHDQLMNLTGIDAEERQARKMMNEIHEYRATLSQDNKRSTPLSVAAFQWLNSIYLPTMNQLDASIKSKISSTELYCQVLEHKWFLSERARNDVGHSTATDDYIKNYGGFNRNGY